MFDFTLIIVTVGGHFVAALSCVNKAWNQRSKRH